MSAPVRPAQLSTVDWLAIAAALLTVAFWASAFVGIRAVAPHLTPGSLAFGRLAVGALALGAIVLVRRGAMPRGRDLAPIVACGVLWFALYNVALNAAERLVDAGTAAMLVNVGPILIALFGWLFLGEGLPSRLIVGLGIAFAGAIVIGAATAGDASLGPEAGLGIVLCLIAALAYAGGVTLQKPVLARVSALNVTWLACTVGLIATTPFAPTLAAELPAAPPDAIAWLVYLGLVPTAFGFTTWAFALGRTSAGRLGATTYLVAPVAIGMSWAILAEVPAALAIVGGTLCIAGVVVARSRARGAPAPNAAQA